MSVAKASVFYNCLSVLFAFVVVLLVFARPHELGMQHELEDEQLFSKCT